VFKLLRVASIGFAAAGALVHGSPAGALSPDLTVVVRAEPEVHPLLLHGALAEAARIYRRSGVTIEWQAPDGPRQVDTVHLHVQARDRISGLGRAVLGTAPRGEDESGRIAYVFVQPVEGLANLGGVDPALLLGAVIAHEVGHLLLPDRGHSEEGLMRAGWGEAEALAAARGLLRFSPDEGDAIHATLRSWQTASPTHARK
jgi:hypothetical protein